MDAIINATAPVIDRRIEVEGKLYVEDVRGRLIPIDLWHDDEPQAGRMEIGGKLHVQDAEGRWVAWNMIKPQDQLQDEIVRKIMAYARDLSAQMARFKAYTEKDTSGYMDLLDQNYGVKVGGPAGNFTLRTIDDLQRIERRVNTLMEFGPEINQAKSLIDECTKEWLDGTRDELRIMVMGAFEVDKKGLINRQKILALRDYDITDERWLRAMQAISDANRPVMTREHWYFKQRSSTSEEFTTLPMNITRA